jgi:hypothetical protein|nr:MAG TPA: hypothetical protein [Caudoviricetes sp.]
MRGGKRKNSGRKNVEVKREKSLTFHVTSEEKEKYDKILKKVKDDNKLRSKVEALFYILDNFENFI